ncbi:MAG: acetyl-CoA C-acyltransferase, partial [candidate division Zixibacteria bacterium]|nr:acetyl-CoA C-acyltransferase [candidate division KSB1 bacterium]NIT74701.1 acetyl-CoA C-acyltransferase [candidate division KSB1 bacterium]NIV08762.1 acetyl-CoA C-acyltransferase [candidate division Zixibacteria bacterium]NIW73015.1 acetyl-CoA C-acyltransferase [candidate division KSB1 bacterium]NIX74381.1 acetyl-CoA C-acyltransferase [candidate division KSB1 bacterium]
MKSDAYIVSSIRTPVGKAKRGSLKNVRPEDLGAIAVNGAISKVAGLNKEQINDVLIGCAMPEGEQGLNLGRVIAQRAGLPDSVPAATINRFCSSGLQTIVTAAQSIMVGHTEVVVAGGAESMSMVPMSGFYFRPNPTLVQNDPDTYVGMGITAENVAEQYNISRDDQDAYSLRSHQKAAAAISEGKFEAEIVPVDVKEVVYSNGHTRSIEFKFQVDEGPRSDTNMEALSKLKPAFKKNGTVTAGNASQMSDGAAASVVMSERMMKELNAEPIA